MKIAKEKKSDVDARHIDVMYVFLFSLSRLNAFLHDLDPMGFHLLNVALHGLASAIFVKMCLEVARVTTTCAFIAGLHFATHPVHTEAVSHTHTILIYLYICI